MLRSPNPDGRPNRNVVRPWANGLDITRRPRGLWIVDFGVDMSEAQAALYEAPFEYVVQHVRPVRAGLRRAHHAARWWLHEEARPGMRRAATPLRRFIATVRHSKHRLFVWLSPDTLPDSALVVFGYEDNYSFGVLHSRVHELWARGTGTQVREAESGFRYTPSSCFETFAFPRATEDQQTAIAEIAAELDRLRQGWLNPPGMSEAELSKRTLTNLYNARPTWLAQIHTRLDGAVLDSYSWPHDLSDKDVVARLLELNLARAAG